MSKVLITTLSVIILFLLGTEVYRLQKEKIGYDREFQEVKQGYDEVQADNERLLDKIDYLGEPRNLEKEMRLKFNYKYPHERLIIVVPDEEATSTDAE